MTANIDCERCGSFALEGDTLCEGCREEANWREAEAYKRRRAHSGIPRTLDAIQLEDLDASGERGPVLHAAKRWAAGELDGLLLHGPVGTGKTTVLAGAANELLGRAPLNWVSVPAALLQLGARFDSDDRRRVVETLTNGHRGIVLDDLDKSRPTGHALAALFAAIDARVANGSPLGITTNLPPLELRKTLGEAIASRILGYCAAVRLDGADRRLTGPASGRAA